MKKINQMIYALILATLLGSCAKKTENAECPDNAPLVYADDCQPIPEPPDFFLEWPLAIPDETIVLKADVNPDNPDQFCVVQSIGSGQEQIVIYDRSTNQSEVILQGDIYAQICWMQGDWLVFQELESALIKRIKTDGSQTENVFEGDNNKLKRNHDHSKLLCQANDVTYIVQGTTVLDTIENVFNSDGNWDHPDEKYVFNDLDGIGIYNSLEEEAQIIPIETNELITEVHWCDNFTKLIWISKEGWFKTNPSTHETTQIRENCDAKNYQFEAHVDNQLLVTRFYNEPFNGDTLLATGKIGLAQYDGSSIELFDLPE